MAPPFSLMPEGILYDTLRIKNWEKFQHYKKRRPPWIKLHFSTLTSKDWVEASDRTRLLAVVCMLIASQSEHRDGRFQADPGYFQRLAYLDTPPDFKPLIELGFLENASMCKQSLADARTETETETETEKPRASRVPSPLEQQKELKDRIKVLAQQKRLLVEAETKKLANVGAGPEIVRRAQ